MRSLWLAGLLFSVLLWLLGVQEMAAVAIALFLLPLFSFGLNHAVRKKLSLSLMLPTTAEKNGQIFITLKLHCGSRLPHGKVLCRLRIRNELTGEESETSLTLPSAGAVVRVCHCGYVRVTVIKASVLDVCGLLPLRFPTKAHAGISVLPELLPPKLLLTLPPPADGADYAPNRSGWDYSEIRQLREYQPGDSLRAVHWKLSGKLERLIVRDASLPATRSLLVYWDKNGAAPEDTDVLADAVASLCQALCEEGIAFHLGWNEKQRFEVREINSSEELCLCLPQLTRYGGETGAPDEEALLQAVRSYGKTLLFAASLPERTAAALAELGGVTAFLCRGECTALPTLTVRRGEGLQSLELDT